MQVRSDIIFSFLDLFFQIQKRAANNDNTVLFNFKTNNHHHKIHHRNYNKTNHEIDCEFHHANFHAMETGDNNHLRSHCDRRT